MIIPSVMTCDFCGNVIERGTHFAKLELPIPPSLRSEMTAYVEAEVLPRVAQSPISLMLGSAESMVPDTWTLEVCIDCAYGIVPGVRETIASQIRESLTRGIEAKRRNEASLESLEPAPPARTRP